MLFPALPLLYFVVLNTAIIIFGYFMIKKAHSIFAWLLLLISLATIWFISGGMHPVVKMLTIITTAFISMKVIVTTESYKGKPTMLTFNQWLLFVVGWAGMRAQPFEYFGGAAVPGAWDMIKFGISRLLAGAMLIVLAHAIVRGSFNPTIIYITVSALLLVSFSLVLHFGLLSTSAGIWRLSGVHAYYLFNRPATSVSLTEFWGKRWNIAFIEMTTIALLRPLRHRLGNAAALLIAFLFSGLLHELALSVPVNKGFGLPLLYFFIQGLMVLLEKRLAFSGSRFLQNRMIARIWVFFWLVVPIPLLFHKAFLQEVIWRLAGL
ncbi:MBOAT family protein [Pedobacter sp. WC2501]|uniref:MBOAT family protein n=1 Tax=Pedobacter sp. WC2501 TaxID=3461400 RepID=UPI00404633CB